MRMKLEKYKQRNPKKIGIAIFTIACVLLIAFVFIYSSFASFQTNETRSFINGNVVDSGDLYFAFYVDGKISSTMPAKGEGYVLDKEKTSCTNGATVEWLNDEWAPKILNFTQTRTKCTLYFKVLTAVDVILAKGETEELKFDNTKDNNLRYVGTNPNNYVRFNNELWRIIGVFNNIENGSGTKETRIKLIKATPYNTSMTWDSNRKNVWSNASLQKELNGTYLDSIESASKTMISDAVWNLGGSSTNNDVTASMFYERERGTTVYSNRPTEWTGKIGLMYPSDYGYATSGGSTTNREACLDIDLYHWYYSSSNNYPDCYNNDWLYSSSYNQWTLTPYASSSNGAFRVNSHGSVFIYSANNTNGVSPALYLNSNVKISGGSGTEESPYTLSL